MSLLDELSTGAWIKWDDLGQGTIITGTVLKAGVSQATKFGTTEPAFWDDGKAKMQLEITLATVLRDPQDQQDDGARSFSINLWSGQKSALVEAMRNAGARDVKPGDQFSAVWVSGAGRTGDPRVFAYKLEPGAGKLADSLASALAAPKADPWAEHQAPAPTPAPPVAAPAPVVAPAVPAPASSPVETARQLLAAGLDVNDVTAATGLSAQIVTALAQTTQSAAAPF